METAKKNPGIPKISAYEHEYAAPGDIEIAGSAAGSNTELGLYSVRAKFIVARYDCPGRICNCAPINSALPLSVVVGTRNYVAPETPCEIRCEAFILFAGGFSTDKFGQKENIFRRKARLRALDDPDHRVEVLPKIMAVGAKLCEKDFHPEFPS